MIRFSMLLALFTLTAGCTSGPGRRTVWHGSVPEQQQEAVVHDPYADQKIAPEIVGGRPREYQKDFSEPQRSQLLQHGLLLPPPP